MESQIEQFKRNYVKMDTSPRHHLRSLLRRHEWLQAAIRQKKRGGQQCTYYLEEFAALEYCIDMMIGQREARQAMP